MSTQQTSQAVDFMSNESVLERLVSRRKAIPEDLLTRFQSGDLGAILVHCVDGRPDEKNIGRYIQRLGGSFGYLIVLIGATRKVFEERFDDSHLNTVIDTVLSVFGKENFLYHSDDHHSDHNGCGFLRSVMDDPEAFGLTFTDVEKLQEFLPKSLRVNVCGAHKEVGVLVVDTPEFITKDEEQFFVLHKFLDNVALAYLCARLSKAFGIGGEELIGFSLDLRDANVAITLQKLGADKLPTFHLS